MATRLVQVSEGADGRDGGDKSGNQRLQVFVEMDWYWLGLGALSISRMRNREEKKVKGGG